MTSDSGLRTTPLMWEMLSQILEESKEKLPASLSEALNLLASGNAKVVEV